MQFEILDSLTLPGDASKPNDDAFAHRARSAVVMDGATSLGEPLMPGKSDAAWVARFGANRLMAHCEEGDAPRDALAATLADTENSFLHLRRRAPAEMWETPFASMMFVSLADSGFEALWYGDCAALVERPGDAIELVGDALKKKSRERDFAVALAKAHGQNAASAGVREIFLPAERAARNRYNSDKGSWLFGPDARAAEHVSSEMLAAPAGTHILLASDGFLALASEYDRYDEASLMRAVHAKGLGALGEELRAIEAEDPEGVRYPRFKKSDDATALLLRIA